MKKFSLETNHFDLEQQRLFNLQSTQIPKHASCLFQKIRITRIGSLDTLELKKKPMLIHTEHEEEIIDDFSRVDILQDTYLEETRAVLELLMNEQKPRHKSTNIHKLKVKQPFKLTVQERIDKSTSLNSYRNFGDNCLINSQIKNINRIPNDKNVNKEIEDILQCKNWKKNKLVTGLKLEKQNIKNYHLLNKKKNKEKINTKVKYKTDRDRKVIKLTINIQETVHKFHKK